MNLDNSTTLDYIPVEEKIKKKLKIKYPRQHVCDTRLFSRLNYEFINDNQSLEKSKQFYGSHVSVVGL